MIEVGGWRLPDGEEHMVLALGKGRVAGGRASYQYDKLRLALSYVRDWRRALDVGAHVGLMTYHLARRFGHVEAFEPVPAHRECFRLNVTAPNVSLHTSALGDRTGTVRLQSVPLSSGDTFIADDGDVRATLRRIDDYAWDDIGLIKLDVEGYELAILRGARAMLERCKPSIMVEQKPGKGRRYAAHDTAAVDYLLGLGAQLHHIRAGDYILSWRRSI